MRRRTTIAEELRHRIGSGRYPPGSKIPTRRELADELGVSSVTLQRAFDRLTEMGFLVSRGKQGTFIADHPPDRAHIALVFGDEQGQGGWNRFWSNMLREAQAWSDPAGRRFVPYFITDSSPDTPAHRRLCADVADGGLAGLFFVSAPFYLPGSPIFASNVPRLATGIPEKVGPEWGSSIDFARPEVRVGQHFAALGRKRVAAICSRQTAQGWKAYAHELARHGLETRQEWWLGLPTDPVGAESARTVTHLLLTGDPDKRPDCLLIDDDNLVPHATGGVLDAGINPPHELEILAYANFPQPTFAAVPTRRYGIDLRHVLRAVIDELDRQRAGGAPGHVTVPVVFA